MIYAQVHTYNGNQQTIAARFDQPDSSWVAYDVPSADWLELVNGAIQISTVDPALAPAKKAQIAILQTAYQTAINTSVSFTNAAGVTSTYPAGNTISLNGQTAMQNLSNVVTAGSSAWSLGKWLDTNNVAQTFTYADLQGLAAAMEAAETLDWQDLVAKVAEVQAATTIAEVAAITF